MELDSEASARRDAQSARLSAFIQRACDVGYLRPDVNAAWARVVLDALVDTAAHRFPEADPPQAADLVVGTFLRGLGSSDA